MSETVKTSRCAFVIIKIRANDEDYLLMRRDPSWRDINFIGGHDLPQDQGSLERTAKRELLEEVPLLRTFESFKLISLTHEVFHGPIFSLSARQEMQYILRFFLLEFTKAPTSFFRAFGKRTDNILLSTRMITEDFYRMSGLVKVLEDKVGGLPAIPYSWADDLGDALRDTELLNTDQMELPLQTPGGLKS